MSIRHVIILLQGRQIDLKSRPVYSLELNEGYRSALLPLKSMRLQAGIYLLSFIERLENGWRGSFHFYFKCKVNK